MPFPADPSGPLRALAWRLGTAGETNGRDLAALAGCADADWRTLLPGEDRAALDEKLASDSPFLLDHRLRLVGDTLFWVRTVGAPDNEGWALISTDVDDLVRSSAPARPDAEVAELRRRLRNVLALVRSIARRTADSATTLEDYVAHFDGRLRAFVRAQVAGMLNPHGSVGLRMIVDDELMACAVREGDQIRISGPDVRILAPQADSLALAVHELATNALKFGALSERGGTLDIRWAVSDHRLCFQWIERADGPPLPNPERFGFGREFLERLMPYELDATSRFELSPQGLDVTLELPLQR